MTIGYCDTFAIPHRCHNNREALYLSVLPPECFCGRSGRACISGNTIANEFRPPEKGNRDSAQSSIARRRARRGSANGCERGKEEAEEEGQFIFMEQRGAQMHRHFATHSFTSGRLRNLGDMSGEFCICKLIVST